MSSNFIRECSSSRHAGTLPVAKIWKALSAAFAGNMAMRKRTPHAQCFCEAAFHFGGKLEGNKINEIAKHSEIWQGNK